MRRRWLLSRTDRLGDLLLTLPMGNFIRQHVPDAEITFLVSQYAAPLVALHVPLFPYLIWQKGVNLAGFEALIHVYPRWTIAWAGCRAGLPRRIGTSRRWYHWLTCTDLPPVKRRRSSKHEAALNLELLAPLLSPELQKKIFTLRWEDLLAYRARLSATESLPDSILQKLQAHSLRIILHTGSGGGSPKWHHWERLAHLFASTLPQALLILTGIASEKPYLQHLQSAVPKASWLDTAGTLSLRELVSLIAQTHLVVAVSTGPLHIAAALDVPTIGLYPPAAAMSPTRWRPLSRYSVILSRTYSCTRCKPASCPCLNSISPEEVLQAAQELLSVGQKFS
ncbi:MAG: glycosyltransferase family 9 protein [Bacteroidia bacterium]|nr:glycosyltransferase family 9 protein [Bacteroidia bacterium]